MTDASSDSGRTVQKSPSLTLVEVFVVSMVLGVLAYVVVPQFSEASTDVKQSRLRVNLGVMRQVLEVYKNEHDGRYPDAATHHAFVMMLTRKPPSDDLSEASDKPASFRGPYLPAIPVNPYTGGNRVSCDSSRTDPRADWIYDSATGHFMANRPDWARNY